jgi:hypothetical protein
VLLLFWLPLLAVLPGLALLLACLTALPLRLALAACCAVACGCCHCFRRCGCSSHSNNSCRRAVSVRYRWATCNDHGGHSQSAVQQNHAQESAS